MGIYVAALTGLGLLLMVIGFIDMAFKSGSYFVSPDGYAISYILIYLGTGMLGVAVLGNLLLMTASSIIDGLALALRRNASDGIEPRESKPYLSPVAGRGSRDSATQGAPNSSHKAQAVVEQSDEAQYSRDAVGWARRQLSASNFEWWEEFGKPNLIPWIREGKPEFKEWVKANKR